MGTMSDESSAQVAADTLLPELFPEEDVWALLALPALTLLATDRRLLTTSGGRVEAWPYDEIAQVGQAGIDGDVVISFDGGHRPLVVHALGDESAMQALTVIGLLVAQTRRLERLRAATPRTAARRG
jgi:xanthine/CO dehydrogenase XdhC/CoxF family maturation factor